MFFKFLESAATVTITAGGGDDSDHRKDHPWLIVVFSVALLWVKFIVIIIMCVCVCVCVCVVCAVFFLSGNANVQWLQRRNWIFHFSSSYSVYLLLVHRAWNIEQQ